MDFTETTTEIIVQPRQGINLIVCISRAITYV